MVVVSACVLGCSAKSELDNCDLVVTTCGQEWTCNDRRYLFQVEEVASPLAPQPFFHFTCRPGLEGRSGEQYEEWFEYSAGRSYLDLCTDTRLAGGSEQLRRVDVFCGWSLINEGAGSCTAPPTPTGRYILEGLASRSNYGNIKGISVLLELPANKLTCGPHLHVLTEEIEPGCLWKLHLRYDATMDGLTHASVLATNTCEHSDWWALYIDAKLVPR